MKQYFKCCYVSLSVYLRASWSVCACSWATLGMLWIRRRSLWIFWSDDTQTEFEKNLAGAWERGVHSDSGSIQYMKRHKKVKSTCHVLRPVNLGGLKHKIVWGRLLEDWVRKWSGAHRSLHQVDAKETWKRCRKGSCLNWRAFWQAFLKNQLSQLYVFSRGVGNSLKCSKRSLSSRLIKVTAFCIWMALHISLRKRKKI